MGVRVGVSGAGIICASAAMALVLFAAPGRAQAPPARLPAPAAAQAPPQPIPVTGFVSSYAILRTARAAGFEPLAPPLRDGTIYLLRATDFRGILMRVVLDARTGAIRDVTRIVPADSDPYEMPPPYGVPPYASPPYAPPPYEPPAYEQPPYEPDGAPAAYDAPPPQLPLPDAGAPMVRPHPAPAHLPPYPLPQPRPADLTTQKPEKTGTTKAPGVNAGTNAAPSVAPGKTPPPAPLND